MQRCAAPELLRLLGCAHWERQARPAILIMCSGVNMPQRGDTVEDVVWGLLAVVAVVVLLLVLWTGIGALVSLLQSPFRVEAYLP